MRVRHCDQNIFVANLRCRLNGLPDVPRLLRIENAVIERKNEQLFPDRGHSGFQPEQRRFERSMDSSRAFMQGSAPHAMINADRWCNIAPSDGGAASGLGRSNDFHALLQRVCIVD